MQIAGRRAGLASSNRGAGHRLRVAPTGSSRLALGIGNVLALFIDCTRVAKGICLCGASAIANGHVPFTADANARLRTFAIGDFVRALFRLAALLPDRPFCRCVIHF